MISKKLTLTIAVTTSLLLPFTVPNALAKNAAHHEKNGIHISGDLQKALRKEMKAVQDGITPMAFHLKNAAKLSKEWGPP